MTTRFVNSPKEFKNLRFQNVTSNYGGRRYLPYAYTEEGIIALAGNLVKVIRRRFDDEMIELLEKLEWWNRNERRIRFKDYLVH